MALLQKFPLFTPRPFCDVTVPNRSSKPVTAMEFRRGGQLSQVVDKVLKTSRLHINAATGAGKSTAFPLALTKAYTNGLVVLVLPFDPMVASLYMFLKNNDAGVQAYWIRDVETPFPKEGLVIVSAATIVARWLSAGNVLLPECIVLHDESHESGVASELIRLVMPVNETVACYVTMTATDPEAHVRNAEMPGKILRSTYDPTAFSDPWSVLDVGAPWMVDQLKGGTLIFEDSDERAQALTQAYKSAAITVFRWTSATKPHLFLADVALMNEPGALCVAIADSSFRSGYTLPLATIVDSGYVTRTITKSDGAIGQIRRPIYQSEMIQSSARGGRLQGLTTRYTRPIGECPDKFCVLEQADVEALAMLCKFMKIELPDMVSRASMVHRGFPADLHAALNAEIPLASHKSELLLSYDEFVKKNCPPMQAKLSTDSGDIGLGRSSSGSNRMKNPFDDLASAIDDLDLSQEDGGDLICGMYAVVTDTVSNSYEDFNLPNAHTSVRKAIGDLSSDATLHIWSKTTRAVALNLAVRTYNTYIMQVKGTAAGVADMSKRRNEIRGSIWHKWVEDTKDSAAVLTAHAHYWFDAILYLSRGFAIVMNADIDFAEEESDVKRHVVQSLSRMMRVSVKPAVLPVCKKKAVCGGSVSSSSSRSSSGSSDRRLDTKRLTNGGMFAETAYYFLVSGNRERQLREAIRNPKPHRRNSSLGSADSF